MMMIDDFNMKRFCNMCDIQFKHKITEQKKNVYFELTFMPVSHSSLLVVIVKSNKPVNSIKL